MLFGNNMASKNNIVCKNFIKNDSGYIHFAGFVEANTTKEQKPMRILGSHAIAYLTKGKGFYKDQTGFKTEIRAGDLIFVDPQFPHLYGPEENHTWEEIFFVFGGSNCDNLSNYTEIIKQNRIGKLLPIDSYKKELLELMNIFQAAEPTDTFYLLSRLQLIIAKAFQAPQTIEDKTAKIITEATEHIRLHVTSEINMEDLAKQLNLTYESFRKKFKQATGLSPMQYKLTAIMELACHQLLTTDKKIKDIAEDLNFCSEFFFSQQFKKSQGIPPKTYRQIMPQNSV